ncbi:hypothetical protein DBV15_11091 [Temnothorax longispinosus]|uniref:Uncharacterized protein n=1 Tax=Temnothorax longispinosus TaxID=300112 RepID=A0A4S2JA81_9HYME|nr:hypothetical protein DBV15_11091 [Temnothorax longispinosus]
MGQESGPELFPRFVCDRLLMLNCLTNKHATPINIVEILGIETELAIMMRKAGEYFAEEQLELL